MQAVSDASIFFSVQKYKASDYFSYFVLLHSNTYLLSVTDFKDTGISSAFYSMLIKMLL